MFHEFIQLSGYQTLINEGYGENHGSLRKGNLLAVCVNLFVHVLQDVIGRWSIKISCFFVWKYGEIVYWIFSERFIQAWFYSLVLAHWSAWPIPIYLRTSLCFQKKWWWLCKPWGCLGLSCWVQGWQDVVASSSLLSVLNVWSITKSNAHWPLYPACIHIVGQVWLRYSEERRRMVCGHSSFGW